MVLGLGILKKESINSTNKCYFWEIEMKCGK